MHLDLISTSLDRNPGIPVYVYRKHVRACARMRVYVSMHAGMYVCRHVGMYVSMYSMFMYSLLQSLFGNMLRRLAI